MAHTNPIRFALEEINKLPKNSPAEAADRGRAVSHAMLEHIAGMTPQERRLLRDSLNREEVGFLFGIAFSGAVYAIRDQRPDYLKDGLLALLIEEKREDFRETVRHLCLLHHSAAKLGVDLAEVYQPLRQHVSQDMQELIGGWFREGTKDIGMMGYAEGALRDGRFTYVPAQ